MAEGPYPKELSEKSNSRGLLGPDLPSVCPPLPWPARWGKVTPHSLSAAQAKHQHLRLPLASCKRSPCLSPSHRNATGKWSPELEEAEGFQRAQTRPPGHSATRRDWWWVWRQMGLRKVQSEKRKRQSVPSGQKAASEGKNTVGSLERGLG